MKKLLIITAFALCCIACKNNEEIKFTETATQGIAGTYSGTWTRALDDDIVSGPGTITFAPSDDPYVTTVTATCAEPAINRAGLVNVAHSDYEYTFYNNSLDESAGFGAKFSGRVYKDGSVDMQYTVEEVVGRFKNTYQFTFVGQKQ